VSLYVFQRLLENTMAKRVGIYARVSTRNGQTTENQLRELRAVAERNGWEVVEVFTDDGVSGAKGREQRPGLDELLKGVARREFDVVAAWSVDRLGRSLQDLIGTLNELRAKDVDLYLHKQGLDTGTPAGKAMFQMLGVFTEFEREIIAERIHAGLARAKEQGTKSGKPIGRPRTSVARRRAVLQAREAGRSIRQIVGELRMSSATVQQVLREDAAQAA
jgi:DNA invertase Pin-like site-specific DNA recombinase